MVNGPCGKCTSEGKITSNKVCFCFLKSSHYWEKCVGHAEEMKEARCCVDWPFLNNANKEPTLCKSAMYNHPPFLNSELLLLLLVIYMHRLSLMIL